MASRGKCLDLRLVRAAPTGRRMSRPVPAVGRANMGDVTPASLAPILLVLGDEELLATRAVTEAVERVRSVETEVDVREYQAGALTVGEIAEMLSPSLFG